MGNVIYPTYREDYRYDVRNRQTQVIQSLSTTPDNATTRYTSTTEYDAVGNPVKRTDPKGNATITEYDSLNRAIKITDPLGGITRFIYDRRDNLIRVIDPKNSITQYAYDRSNRKLAEVRPLGDKTIYRYDTNSNLTETISANGNKKSFTYDALNRRISESHFLGTGSIPGTTPITIAQFNGATTSNINNLITGNAQSGSPITTGSRAISYVYDKNGNLTSWNDRQASSTAASNPNDPNHATTSSNADVLSGTFIYDEVNRQISIGTSYSVPNLANPNNPSTSSFTKTSLQSYSAAGRLKTRTDADGKSHTLDYDAAGRVAKLALPSVASSGAGSGASAGDILFPQYQWNQIKEIQFPSGVRQTYQYDALQRPTEIKVAPPATGSNNPNPAPVNQNPLMNFTYQYDEASNPTQITRAFAGCNAFAPQPVPPAPACDPNAASATYSIQTNYGYDKLYRLTNVIPNQITNATPTETYVYDLVHNRLAEQKSNHPSGLIGNASNSSNTSTVGRAFTYNANHQLAGIAQLVQAINPANQTDPNNLPSNAFGSVLENRAYSADGHTKDVAPTGSNNELTGATINAAQRIYLYDASERLIEVKTAGNQTVATYRYDPFGRRVRKTVSIPNTTITPQNPIAQQAGTTFFGFASEGMIAEFRDTGNVEVSYAYVPNTSEADNIVWQTNPIYKRTARSNTDLIYSFHNDQLGTPHVLSLLAAPDASNLGKVSWRANYESFGEAFIDQIIVNSTNLFSSFATENNNRFPGQYFDQETELAQNLMRDYDSALGSYLQLDPLYQDSGTAHKYVNGNPLSHVDETGEILQLPVLFCVRFPRICRELYRCIVNPARCKKRFCRIGHSLYKPMCENIPDCQYCPAENCATSTAKLTYLLGCLSLRQAVGRFCYGDNHVGHQIQNRMVETKILKCSIAVGINCGGCCG
jgi:RHS repeat-associated protein